MLLNCRLEQTCFEMWKKLHCGEFCLFFFKKKGERKNRFCFLFAFVLHFDCRILVVSLSLCVVFHFVFFFFSKIFWIFRPQRLRLWAFCTTLLWSCWLEDTMSTLPLQFLILNCTSTRWLVISVTKKLKKKKKKKKKKSIKKSKLILFSYLKNLSKLMLAAGVKDFSVMEVSLHFSLF